MRILFSPIDVLLDAKIEYKFEDEKIIATMDNKTDTFDFSNMPDGKAVVEEIETILPVNPVISAERKNGILSVKLLNYIGENATHDECFPEWQEV